METAVDYKQKYEESQLAVATLKQELETLKKLIFGSRHERFVPQHNSPQQLGLDIQLADVVEASSVVNAKKITYTRTTISGEQPKQLPSRLPLPQHLERREVIIEPLQDTTGLRRLGEEITEELDYEPGKVFVRRFIRPRYVSSDNQSFVIAPMIDRPLPKAICGAGLLTQIIIDKYIDHLPLNRQMDRLKREGVALPYSTITDWVHATAKLIDPLYASLKKQVVSSDYLNVDETPVKVLDRDKKGTTHRGYFWLYYSSQRDLLLFDYQPGRGREGPKAMLEGFKGHLQVDGYSAYDIFSTHKDITLVHCMAHARRKFFEAQDNDLQRSQYALTQIQELYEIERKCRQDNLTEEQRFALRQKQAVPILNKLGEWMQKNYIQVLPKSAIGLALAYSIKRWPQLMLYTCDGKLQIDNNAAERAIRSVALGRKTHLFCGSHEAAQRSAMLYSLMGSCRLHGINPFIYLRDVLTRIAAHPVNKISELLPQNWNLLT